MFILYHDINENTIEGRLLKAALVMMAIQRNKDEKPSDVLNKVREFEEMLHPEYDDA